MGVHRQAPPFTAEKVTAVGKFEDTDQMNAQIKEILEDSDIRESNTSVVLDTGKENEQFELDIEA